MVHRADELDGQLADQALVAGTPGDRAPVVRCTEHREADDAHQLGAHRRAEAKRDVDGDRRSANGRAGEAVQPVEERLALDAAIAHARALGVAQVVAVLDEGGHLLAFGRMDGAPLPSVRAAQDKAYSALIGLPAGTQFLHFAALLLTGTIFLGGYLMRWRHTPWATVVMYAVLATICFIETVDSHAFGGGPTRFIPMAIEYVTYFGLSAYLLRSSAMRRRFSPVPFMT